MTLVVSSSCRVQIAISQPVDRDRVDGDQVGTDYTRIRRGQSELQVARFRCSIYGCIAVFNRNGWPPGLTVLHEQADGTRRVIVAQQHVRMRIRRSLASLGSVNRHRRET
jgi:hypothetical protein